jgi:hypothetical protein
MDQDLVFLIQSANVLPHLGLPHLYPKGYSSIADVSKHFHIFKIHKEEQLYLGCIHPVIGVFLVYVGFPMGRGDSPVVMEDHFTPTTPNQILVIFHLSGMEKLLLPGAVCSGIWF